jgi:transposase
MAKKKPTSSKGIKLPKHLQHLNQKAAGIDIGSRSHFVAIPEGMAEQSVREFSTFTDDLEALADWLVSCGITTVAMESTGIYWIPVFEIIERRGIEVRLVNAHHVKNVPGRKSDVLDCQWLQQLHTYGLMRGAFRPKSQVCELRSYVRQRATLIRNAASHIQHMQKALAQMNILLHNVVTDITGMTGMRIIKAILAGERNPHKLAAMRDIRCKNDAATIARSLHGTYSKEHLFSLKQAVELYEFYLKQIADCDQQILEQLKSFDTKHDDKDSDNDNDPKAPRTVEEALQKMSGVDLSAIDGISTVTALKVIAEIGIDMSQWKTEKHFASWLGLCPGSKISGGKVLSRATRQVANRAAAALRMSAVSLQNSKSALGAYFRRMRTRLGTPKAITATAHKLARLVYSMLKNGTEYVDFGQKQYEERYKARVVQNIKKRAQELGFEMIPIQPEMQNA